ncbi:MFS general substrate transporter [Microthyrium microscopicum]|uniref:MFS general substrate transporter n=1 Tax=Microthyrium microscopicum TaxID=703497 RepID=A0A6A6UL25_9PEZI|nr:MFS general substrate transporter [Microthyrium microscopicum]
MASTTIPPDDHSRLLGDQNEDGDPPIQTYGTQPEPEDDHHHKNPDSPYLIDATRTKFWFIFGPILLQYFVAMFDSYFMASSHPVITSYFNASNSASWLSTSFMLTSTATQPVFGRLSDTIGRRPVYLTALVGFMVTTAWCAGAQSIGSLIAARALCGIAAGGVLSMAGIMTNDLVKIEVRGTYQAYINLLYGSGAAFGTAFGGALCDTIGWRGAFAIQIPLILFITICAYINVPSNLGPQLAKHSSLTVRQTIQQFDIAGSLLLMLSVALLILGLNLGGNILPWSNPFVIGSLIVSLIAGGVLVWVESKALRPVMPLAMIASPPRSNIVLSNFFSMIGINHILFNAPLYFQAVHSDTPSIAGFRLAIPAVLTTICGVSTGFFLTYTGRLHAPQIAGAISMLSGAVGLSSMPRDVPMWIATALCAPTGIGQGLMFPATTLAVLAISSVEEQAAMTSTLMLWRNLGTVMGVAVSSLVLQNTLVQYLEKYITGPDKQAVIEKVRKSVRAVLELKGETHEQALMAYSDALRWTFISAIGFFVVVNVLIIPVKLPWLRKDRVAANVEEDGEYQD